MYKKLLLVLILSFFSINLTAQIPKTFTWQGVVQDASGNNLDGTYNLSFSLYENATGGTSIWTENRTNLQITDGLVSVNLGSLSLLTGFDFDEPYYLGITINGGTELPRISLASSPYAFTSDLALSIDDNTVTSPKIVDGTIQSQDIGANQIYGANNGAINHFFPRTIGAPDIGVDAIFGSALAGPNQNHIYPNSIAAAEIAADAVGNSELAPNAVTSLEILNGTIQNIDISAGDISGSAGAKANIVEAGSIDTPDLADDAITSPKILNATIIGADIANGEVVRSLNTLTDMINIVGDDCINVAVNGQDIEVTYDPTCCECVVEDGIVIPFPDGQEGDGIFINVNVGIQIIWQGNIIVQIHKDNIEFNIEVNFNEQITVNLENNITFVVIPGEGFGIKDADGNWITRFGTDGTSLHTGKETYEDDIEKTNPDGSKTTIGENGTTHTNPDGSKTTTSGPDGTTVTETDPQDGSSESTDVTKDGTETKSTDSEGEETTITKVGRDENGNGEIIINDSEGNPIFRVDETGSYHHVPETYYYDIVREHTDGSTTTIGQGGITHTTPDNSKTTTTTPGETTTSEALEGGETRGTTTTNGSGVKVEYNPLDGTDPVDIAEMGNDGQGNGRIVIRDKNGNKIFEVNKDGSFHYVNETYYGDIIKTNEDPQGDGSTTTIGTTGISVADNNGNTTTTTSTSTTKSNQDQAGNTNTNESTSEKNEQTRDNIDGSREQTTSTPNGVSVKKDAGDGTGDVEIAKIGNDGDGNGEIVLKDSDGNEIFRVDETGSYHNVPENFVFIEAGAIESDNINADVYTGGIITAYAPNTPGYVQVKNTNDTQVLVASSDDNGSAELELKDESGNTIYKVDKSGSYHYVPETFYEGITVPNDQDEEKVKAEVDEDGDGKVTVKKDNFMKLEFKGATVTSTNIGGGSENVPEEELTLYFGGIKMDYNGNTKASFEFDGNNDANLKFGGTGQFDPKTVIKQNNISLDAFGESELNLNGSGFELKTGGTTPVSIDPTSVNTPKVNNPNGDLALNSDGNINIEPAATGIINVEGGVNGCGFIFEANSFDECSDRRLKENIKPLENALDKVLNIEGYYFNMKDDETKKRRIGFIAQQINTQLPEVVSLASNNYYAVSYSNVTALLVEAVKEQNEIIQQQQKEINELKAAQNEMQVLKAQYNEMQKMMNQMMKHINNNNEIKKAELTK